MGDGFQGVQAIQESIRVLICPPSSSGGRSTVDCFSVKLLPEALHSWLKTARFELELHLRQPPFTKAKCKAG
jgi:hypothetical protein